VRLSERSYSTKSVRPRPTVYAEPDGSLLVITTSWGETELAHRVNEDIAKYVQAAMADVEVTSPFEFLTCFSDETNYLRVALLIANDSVYRGDNRGEYLGAIETLVIFRRDNKIAYAQVGAPNLMIQKDGNQCESLAPMPQSLLGVDPTVNIRCGDFRVEDNDRLIVYSGAFWPESLWAPTHTDEDLRHLTQKIVQQSPDSPFWLGLIAL
jgi:hypothetical protein